MKQARVLIPLVFIVTLMASFGSAAAVEARPDGAAGGTLVVTQGVDPRTLGPWTSVAAELSVTTQIFERLIDFNPRTKQFRPVLAEKWRFVDPQTLDITLRRGITFSNGEALTGDAAVFSFRQLLNPKVGGIELGTRTANIDSVRRVGPRTLRVSYKRPQSSAQNLAYLAQSAFMVPPKYYRQVGHKGFADQPIGSGPFRLESRLRASRIVLVANPRYKGFSGARPRVQRIEFRILPEAGARISALRSGDVHIVVDVPPDNAAPLRSERNLRVAAIPGLRVMELQVDMRHNLSDASKKQFVRQALMVGLDRQRIIEAVFLGLGRPANQLATPNYVGYLPSLPPLRFDPDRAKRLLAQAGFPDGLTLPMACPSGRYLKDREVCQVIASELGKIGIRVPLTVLEVGAYFQGVLAGKVGPIIYIGRLAPSLNVLDMLNSSLCTSQDSYKCDETLDRLHAQALGILDPKKQAEASEKAVRRDLGNPARIPLWVLSDVYAASTRVTGWQPRPDQVLEFWGVGLAR